MPDGLTHVLSGYVGLNRWLKGARLALFLVGSVLPDIFLRGGRLPIMGLPQRDFYESFLVPLHSPFVAIFICLALSQFFHSEIRKSAFGWLYAGCCSHFLLDVLQRTIEQSGGNLPNYEGYQWLFPLSGTNFQLGLFWPEDAPYALILLVPLAGWTYWYRQRKRFGSSGLQKKIDTV